MKMWLLAMAGIPMLVISLDVLTRRRLTDQLREILFRPEQTQIFEPRDVIWAWALALFGGFLVVWGLKELFVPTKVLECRPEGLALRLSGPFRPASVIPWENIVDVDGVVVDDETGKTPTLWLKLADRSDVPDNPWGARWMAADELGMLGQDWTEPPTIVAEKVADYAVEVAKQGDGASAITEEE
jgi:hypothetical protein